VEVNASMINKIIDIIRNNIESEGKIEENTNLRKDLDIDSFDVLMIMNALDDEYSISIDEDDFKEVNTPKEIVALLQKKYGLR